MRILQRYDFPEIPITELCVGDIITRIDVNESYLILSIENPYIYDSESRDIHKFNLQTQQIEKHNLCSIHANYWSIYRDGVCVSDATKHQDCRDSYKSHL